MRKHYRPFFKSLGYALKGIQSAIKYEVHMRIHLLVAATSIGFGFYINLSKMEWLILCLTINLVLFSELFNTALEANVDLVTKEKKPEAMLAKDVAAGAVLIASINAIVVGWFLFGTKVFSF